MKQSVSGGGHCVVLDRAPGHRSGKVDWPEGGIEALPLPPYNPELKARSSVAFRSFGRSSPKQDLFETLERVLQS